MKRVLTGAIACLALTGIGADNCSGASIVPYSGKEPLTVSVAAFVRTEKAGPQRFSLYEITGVGGFDAVVKQLASGDNSFAVRRVPEPPVGFILVPPADNTATLTLKQHATDQGLRVAKTFPTVMVFDSEAVPTNIIVNSSSAFAARQVLTITWF